MSEERGDRFVAFHYGPFATKGERLLDKCIKCGKFVEDGKSSISIVTSEVSLVSQVLGNEVLETPYDYIILFGPFAKYRFKRLLEREGINVSSLSGIII